MPHVDPYWRVGLAEDDLQPPQATRRGWYRLAALLHARGDLDHDTLTLAGHYTMHVDAHRDRLAPEHEIARAYARMFRVTERTFRTRRRQLVGAGLLTVAVAAAPGRPARYALTIPERFLDDPGDLPTDLAVYLGLLTDDDLYGPTPATAHPPATEPEPEPETGPGTPPEPAPDNPTLTSGFSNVSFYREGSSPLGGSVTVPAAPERVTNDQGAISPVLQNRLEANAWQVLARSRPWWTHQRGPGRGLDPEAQQKLLPLLVAALRRSTPTELIETITFRTRSAHNLAGVIAHRLWQLVNTRTPFDERPTEPSPQLKAKAIATRTQQTARQAAAIDLHTRTTAARTAARQALHAALAARDTQNLPKAPDAPAAARHWAREPEQVFRAELTTDPDQVDPGADQARTARQNHARALARARRERATRNTG